MAPVDDMNITEEELSLVKAAARRSANNTSIEDISLDDYAQRWREIATPWAKAARWASATHYMATRLCETYARMYPELEEEGGIDGWAGGECRSVLLDTSCSSRARLTPARRLSERRWTSAT